MGTGSSSTMGVGSLKELYLAELLLNFTKGLLRVFQLFGHL